MGLGIHPCCGGSLQTGAKTIAIVQMILAILGLLGGIPMLAYGCFGGSNLGDPALLIAVSIPLIVSATIDLILSVVLHKAASNRSLRQSQIWFIVGGVILLLELILLALLLFGHLFPPIGVGFGIDFFTSSYFMWVVYAFIQELREEEDSKGRMGQGQQQLPKA